MAKMAKKALGKSNKKASARGRRVIRTSDKKRSGSRKASKSGLKKRRPVNVINVFEEDPGVGAQPSGSRTIQQAVPTLASPPLPIRITNPAHAPAAGIHPVGTAGFRYWNAASALRRAADFWGGLLPGVSWQVGSTLPVDLDNGDDLNAYYDRIGLKFFHGNAGRITVYSGESPDVVCHELGHALLDSIKPQLWDAASIEVAAFHESVGDISAILSALQIQSLRVAVLEETANVLYRASNLSRLAEQLGWAIRQSVPSAVEADCLRNAVNSFFYRDPDTLPSRAPATVLSSEPHSFSRVFTGAFFEGLAGMLKARPAQDEQNLLQVSQDAGRILTGAVRAASVVPTFYSQVAANMLSIASSQFRPQNYEQALRSAFVRHGVLPPAMAVAVTAPGRAAAEAAAPPEEDGGELPQQQLSIGEYGLGVATITVFAAAQPKRYDVAGAALAVGAAPATAEDVAAKAFFEDLLRRGRLKLAEAPEQRAEIVRAVAPPSHDTYTHELRKEGSQFVLRRVRVDCCFCCRGV
jgi:hypothetical protein